MPRHDNVCVKYVPAEFSTGVDYVATFGDLNEFDDPHGYGETPEEAIQDLMAQMDEGEVT